MQQIKKHNKYKKPQQNTTNQKTTEQKKKKTQQSKTLKETKSESTTANLETQSLLKYHMLVVDWSRLMTIARIK